jgi:hypothetical protein
MADHIPYIQPRPPPEPMIHAVAFAARSVLLPLSLHRRLPVFIQDARSELIIIPEDTEVDQLSIWARLKH